MATDLERKDSIVAEFEALKVGPTCPFLDKVCFLCTTAQFEDTDSMTDTSRNSYQNLQASPSPIRCSSSRVLSLESRWQDMYPRRSPLLKHLQTKAFDASRSRLH